MFEVRLIEFNDNYEYSLIIIIRFAIWIWFWCHNTTRYFSTIKALWKGSAGFQATMDVAERPGSLWKSSFKETCCHKRWSENFSSACLPWWTGLLTSVQFFPPSFLLPGSTTLINLLALLHFILLWTDLSWRNLSLYISVIVSWKDLCIIFIYLFLPANTLILAEGLLA